MPPPMPQQAASRLTLAQLLFLAMNAAAVLAAAGQVLIDIGVVNLGCSALVLASVVATMQYLERSRAFEDTPVSSLAVLGLCVTTQWASLTAQSLAGTPLVEGLKLPVTTFAVLCGVQALALASHWIYRRFQPLQQVRSALSDAVAAPLGLYRTPSPAAVWALSLFGAAAIAAGGAEAGDAGGKLFQAFGLFAWLPAMIPILYARYGSAYCRIGTQVPLLVGYALLLVAIGLARNGRSLMIVGPMQLALVLLIYGLRDHRAATSKVVALLLAGALGAGLVTFGARDLATAMVVVRDQRESLAPLDMLQETLAALGDRGKLELFRDTEKGMSRFQAYDEIYLDNPLIARFSETKFHDNMLAILEQLNAEERASIAELTGIKLLTFLPQPLLDRLGTGIDKERYEFSVGDHYRSLTESEEFLGGYAVGSIWADLLAIFDWWSPLVVVLICFGVYLMLDVLSRTDRDGALLLSPLAVCIAWSVFLYGLSADSLAARLAFFLRDQPQRFLLYAGAAALLHWILPWRPSTPEAPPAPLPASSAGTSR
ncbi:MAG TPA: hypothetical protein VFR90_12440 [Methylibium sp.]|uniref:hypothetical protein n=1 Tax=Methylibium sp. TaxID=2067992 RepID=UPI002DB97E71|nr:hypothetical protein [Methylibium sp.]HEU4459924.1 hypothetical protein [Methylibium sp.]